MVRSRIPTESFGKIWRTHIRGKKAAGAWYRDSAGKMKRMYRTADTWPKAEAALKDAIEKRLSGADTDLTADSTVRELSELWWAEFELTAPATGTMRTHRSNLNTILAGLGDVRLHECTVPRVNRFLKSIKQADGRQAQARGHRSILRAMFKLAVQHGAMRANPMDNVSGVPAVPKAERRPVAAPDATAVGEIRRLLCAFDAAVDGRGMVRGTPLGDLAIMFAATGARTSEVLALTWDDIDFDAEVPSVVISATLTKEFEGGRLIRQEYPKTQNSERVLKLPPFAVDMLIRRRVDSYNEKVFPSMRGTWLAPDNMRWKWWNPALKGTPYEGTTPKSFRKAVATLIGRAEDAETAAQQLGNTKAVALKHYIAPMNEGPDAVDLLEAAFGYESPESSAA